MNGWLIFMGSCFYEFRMQVRRPAMWATLMVMMLLMAGIFNLFPGGIQGFIEQVDVMEVRTVTGFWGAIMNFILPLGLGIMVADRLRRDRKTRMDEMFTSFSGSLLARLWGKYLGSVFATMLPIVLFYVSGLAIILARTQDVMVLPYGLLAFVTMMLPSVLYIGAFSVACPALIWQPIYIFLLIGYWGWNNFLSPERGIPTLNGTILSPTGGPALKAFFAIDYYYYPPGTDIVIGVGSILLLLSLATLAIMVLWGWMRWQQARQ